MLNFVEMGWKWESNYKWKWNGTDLDLAEWDGMEWELKTCPVKSSNRRYTTRYRIKKRRAYNQR